MSADMLHPGAALIRTGNTVYEMYEEVSAAAGVTGQQARLLYVLHRKPTNMLGLGSVLGVGKSTMTGVVARMEAAGLVQRSPDPDDRRHLVVTPTPHGAEVADQLERELRHRVAVLLGGFDPEETQQLVILLSRVIERAEELRQRE
jgi:DNA-binding MarR family transcriptional regulator